MRRILSSCLADAGITDTDVYVTNAVKHFNETARHATPVSSSGTKARTPRLGLNVTGSARPARRQGSQFAACDVHGAVSAGGAVES